MSWSTGPSGAFSSGAGPGKGEVLAVRAEPDGFAAKAPGTGACVAAAATPSAAARASIQADQPSSARSGRRTLASLASWPDMSSPISRSPSMWSNETGSPRAFSSSTAVSVTVWAATAGRNAPSSSFSGPPKTPGLRIVPGSPAPPRTGGSGRLARVLGPGDMMPVGGTYMTMPGLSTPPRCRRASTRRQPAAAPPRAAATSVAGWSSSSRITARPD